MATDNEVETIRNLTREGLIVKVGDKTYSALDLKAVVDRRPLKTLSLGTLTGLVAYLRANMDKEVFVPALCIINDHENVSVVDNIDETSRMRETIVTVTLQNHGNKFQFGQYMEHEKFIIALKTMFVESWKQGELIQFVSTLTINNSLEVQDDGVSQQAIVKRGISGAIKNKAIAPSIVELSPYRTFLEINQPSSNFLFRMLTSEGKVPMCALFEADGGNWRKDAMERISIYLKETLSIPVIY